MRISRAINRLIDEPIKSLAANPANSRTNRPGGLTLTREALAACAFAPGDLILDAGCGFGATVRLAREEKGLGCVGLDADPSRLAAAREEAGTYEQAGACKQGGENVPLVVARLPRLPFQPGIFKGIFCECVLSLVPEKRACLEGFYAALAPGGRLILADLVLPDSTLPESAFPNGGEGQPAETRPPATCLDGALTEADLLAEIERAGFQILEVRDHTRLLKEMACEMVFEHGSLDRFWRSLTGTDVCTGMAGRCRAGKLKPGYTLVTAVKHG